MTSPTDADVEALELDLLLEGLHRRYGYDFRDYARASLGRRVAGFLTRERLEGTLSLLDRVLRDGALWERLLGALTVGTTAMFRDPTFYLAFREKVVPQLRTYPFVRVWIAGCSTGEELFSAAIVLDEEGLLDRCRLYATDLNEDALKSAKAGVFSLGAMKENTANYQAAGGMRPFSDYYTADGDLAIFRPTLAKNMVFAAHNLTSDASFNEFQAVFIRNVMIYFNRVLQDRVHRLVYESLCRLGFLCLGQKESIRFSPLEGCYEEFVGSERIFRKIKDRAKA